MAETLGSYKEFLDERGLQHSQEAFEEYDTALYGLRYALAKERNISLEELHSQPLPLSSPKNLETVNAA